MFFSEELWLLLVNRNLISYKSVTLSLCSLNAVILVALPELTSNGVKEKTGRGH